MKEQKVRVILQIYFKPNEKLEKRIRATMKRPFRFAGSGQYVGIYTMRDMEYMAMAPTSRLVDMRRMAYTIRRWKGIGSVYFTVEERVPLTSGPVAFTARKR